MRAFIVSLLIMFVFQIFIFAEQNTMEFRLAYTQKKRGTILFHNKFGEIYVDKRPVLKIADIKKAAVVVTKKGAPEWLDSAIKSSGAIMPPSQIYIEIEFNKKGRKKLKEITSQNIGNLMAIFIDNKFIMAPQIIEEIEHGKFFITTCYTESEAELIVKKINKQI